MDAHICQNAENAVSTHVIHTRGSSNCPLLSPRKGASTDGPKSQARSVTYNPVIRKGTQRNSSWPGESPLHTKAEYICADLSIHPFAFLLQSRG